MGHNNRLFWIRDRGSGMRDPGRVKIIDYFRGSWIPDPGSGVWDPIFGIWGSGIPDPGSGGSQTDYFPGCGIKLIIMRLKKKAIYPV